MKNIEFVKILEVSDEFYPYPASEKLPEWYMKTPVGTGNPADGELSASIRWCMPTYDALTAGYIIPTPTDYFHNVVERDGEKGSYFTKKDGSPSIITQPAAHAPLHPNKPPHGDFLKFECPWIFKTPLGYSTLFIPPMQHPNEYFTALPFILDTDTFYHRVALPFVLKDQDFTGTIPAGTPILQAIPFRREDWEMSVVNPDQGLLSAAMAKISSRLFLAYRHAFWIKKKFK
jgi:hypothetical protein